METTLHIDGAAAVLNFLTLERKDAIRRLREWNDLEAQVTSAEAKASDARVARDARAAEIATAAAKRNRAQTNFRTAVEAAERSASESEELLLRDEAEWRGLGKPDELQ